MRPLYGKDGKLIRKVVVQKPSRFRALRWGVQQPQQLLVNWELCHLGTLIALINDPTSGGLSTAPESVGLETCPKLAVIQAQPWQNSQGHSSGAAS